MRRKPDSPVLRRLAGLGLLAVGLVFLAVGAWHRWSGITPESELRFVNGPATEVHVEPRRTGRQKSELLSFRVEGQSFTYPSARHGYSQLLAAARTGVPITVAYAPADGVFGPRSNAVEAYAVSLADQPIRTYADQVADEQRGSMSAIVLGGGLLALAFFVLGRRGRKRQGER
jgi:hypothetical protein